MRTTLSALAPALLASTALAQGFVNDIGVGLGALGDDALSTQTLMHSFPFPGGISTTTIDIDTNGRVIPNRVGNMSIFGESVPLLFTEPPSVCGYWDDLTPSGLAAPNTRGEIYFSTSAQRTVITWCNAKRFGTTTFDHNDFTFQIQLYPSGRVVIARDNRAFSTNSIIVGLSAGDNAADPGEADLSAGGASGGQPSVYEDFTRTGTGGASDLIGKSLDFMPDGTGGYNWTVHESGPPPCGAEKFGAPTPVSIEFFPIAPGGPYNVFRSNAAFFDDGGLGAPGVTDIGTGLGDDAITAPQAFNWTPTAQNPNAEFIWPGGTPSIDVSVDNNGRAVANSSLPSTCCPEAADILSGSPSINAFWTDLSSQEGSLRFYTDGVGMAAITWENVPQFAETLTHTFQIVMRIDGSFALNYKNVTDWQTGSGYGGDNVCIGCGEGEDPMGNPATDPGEIDFANLSSGFISSGPTVYEFWDAGHGQPAANVEVPDIQTILWPWVTDGSSPINRTWSEPRVGMPYTVQLEGISTGNISTVFAIGFETHIPLDFFGLPGVELLTDPIIATIGATPGPDRTASFTFTIPMGSSTGAALTIQGHAISATESPSLAFPAILTNGVRGVVRM